jgi:hypothetical protein
MPEQRLAKARRPLSHRLELCLMAVGAIILSVIAAVDLVLMLNGG